LNNASAIVARDSSGQASLSTLTTSCINPISTILDICSSGGSPALYLGVCSGSTVNIGGGTTNIAGNTISLGSTSSNLTVGPLNTGSAGLVHANTLGKISNYLLQTADLDTTANLQIANGYTTATNANTPNAIVARDGNSSFACNWIYANDVNTQGINIMPTGSSMQPRVFSMSCRREDVQEAWHLKRLVAQIGYGFTTTTMRQRSFPGMFGWLG